MNWADTIGAYLRARLLMHSPSLLARAERARPDLATAPVTGAAAYRAGFATHNDLGLDLDTARTLAQQEAVGQATGHTGLSFGLSTGTMGKPGVFIASDRDRARWLGSFLARVVPLTLALRGRAAILLRHDSRLYHQTGGRTAFIPLGLGVEGAAAALAAARPRIIIGPPFALRRLVESGRLRPHRWNVSLVVAGGEPLWPADAALLREAFEAPVREVYQAAEGFFAAACRHGRLHFNSDLVRVEKAAFTQDPTRFVPIVTDLVRDGPQRMVRYRTEDVAICSGAPCPCGSALPGCDGIEGRLADLILAPDGRLLFPRLLDAALGSPARPFRIVQTGADQLRLELPPGAAAAPLARRLAEVGGMVVTPAPLILGDLTVKFRRTQRLIALAAEALTDRLQPPVMLSTMDRNRSAGR